MLPHNIKNGVCRYKGSQYHFHMHIQYVTFQRHCCCLATALYTTFHFHLRNLLAHITHTPHHGQQPRVAPCLAWDDTSTALQPSHTTCSCLLYCIRLVSFHLLHMQIFSGHFQKLEPRVPLPLPIHYCRTLLTCF